MKRVIMSIRMAVAFSLVVGAALGVKDWVTSSGEANAAQRAVKVQDSVPQAVSFAVPSK